MNFTTQRVLGYIMSKEGRRVDPSLLDAINKIAPPKTLQGIQSLLGLAQVAREYIPGLATLIAPLQKLSRKGVDVEAEWKDEEQGVALRNLQTVLTNAPVLLIPDISKSSECMSITVAWSAGMVLYFFKKTNKEHGNLLRIGLEIDCG